MLKAYPRSHGATDMAPTVLMRKMGLSPLARGNRAGPGSGVQLLGPIPARTGQPLQTVSGWPLPRAYPRSHGATWDLVADCRAVMGLSPLARGNRPLCINLISASGPIPARTGQPHQAAQAVRCQRAYPRSHGAT